MFNFLHYAFFTRALVAGGVIAIIAPIIGTFLVLRRYSLIADTLSHVSLAGIALGLILNISPMISATITTVLASLIIDKLRLSRKIYGESALALFLAGSLALAVILLGLSHGLTANLFNYLFGSILTVTSSDIWRIIILAFIVVVTICLCYPQLLYITFDEESAKVRGIKVDFYNTIFIILSAVTIALAIPVVGILLISALLVIPVISALQLKKSFLPTILVGQVFSLFSVIGGLILSFYFNLASGGTIVLTSLVIFIIVFVSRNKS